MIYRTISLVAGIGTLFYTSWHDKTYASNCFAIEGNFWPMYKSCPTCNDYIEGDLKNTTYSDP